MFCLGAVRKKFVEKFQLSFKIRQEQRVLIVNTYVHVGGPLMVAQWLRYCATNRKVAGSIPDGAIGIFH
jgi:hypothetical protein